jgi:Cu/Zn superoxide dismutase
MKLVAILFNHEYKPKGKVVISEIGKRKIEINVRATGLKPGYHGFHIHQSGDLSRKCDSLCAHYNPTNSDHGARYDKHNRHKPRHLGDLGNIKANSKGVVNETFVQSNIDIYDIIGRSMVIHADKDDLGKGRNDESLKTGNSGKRILCGVLGIAEDQCS